MKIQVTKIGVTEGRSEIPVGMVIELDDKNALALVSEGYAMMIEEQPSEGQGNPPTPEAMTKSLDKAFRADDLKAAAKAAGVVFADDATKATVIAAVLTAGKYDDLMKQ